MKRGDKVLVPTGDAAGSTVEGVVRSVNDDGFAMCDVPAGSMHLGRRATKALRRVEDLKPVGASEDPGDLDFEDMNKKQLKAAAKAADLSVSGSKADLVARLTDAEE